MTAFRRRRTRCEACRAFHFTIDHWCDAEDKNSSCHPAHSPWHCPLQTLSFARGKSDAAAKADGTWVPKEKRGIQARMLEDRGKLPCARCGYFFHFFAN